MNLYATQITDAQFKGTWSSIGKKIKAKIATPAAYNSKVSLAFGKDTLAWTVTGPNSFSKVDTVIITANFFTAKANAGIDKVIYSDTTTLKGNSLTGATAAWKKLSGASTISSPTVSTTKITKLSVGNNLFEYSLTIGKCVSRDSILVKYAVKDTAKAGTDIFACVDSTVLAARKPKTANKGKWSFANKKVHAIKIANDTLFNTKISGITVAKDTLVWTVTNLVDSTQSRDSVIVSNAKIGVAITKPSKLADLICVSEICSISRFGILAFDIYSGV